jgi:hypothetical protein
MNKRHQTLVKFYLLLVLILVVIVVYLAIKTTISKNNGVPVEISNTKITSIPSPSPNVDINACNDFATFSDYILEHITKPDSVEKNVTNYEFFYWRRDRNEPYVGYPAIKSSYAVYTGEPYEGKSGFDLNNYFRTHIKTNSEQIGSSIVQITQTLGFEKDTLNTIPYKSFSNGDTLQVFAFNKNNEKYYVLLNNQASHQAVGVGVVKIQCGKSLKAYDMWYDRLNFKADSSAEDPYNNDNIAITDISVDENVIGLLGSSSSVDSFEYYFFSNNHIEVISKGKSFIFCSDLERRKIGLGIGCVDYGGGSIRSAYYN